MKIFDRVGQFLINVLIVLIVLVTAFSVYSFVMINVMDRDYVSLFGYTYFEVVSGSMEPSIGVNDIVIVKLDDEFVKGDIVTYNVDGDFVTHRIVDLGADSVITKGDNNNTRDKAISYDSVIGTVCFIIPKGGVWKCVFMTPKVLLLLILTLTLFSFTFSYNSRSKRKKIKKQRLKRECLSVGDVPVKESDREDV